MNVHLLWSVAALTAELAEVATYLRSDKHYSNASAAEQLETIIANHLQPLLEKAFQEGE